MQINKQPNTRFAAIDLGSNTFRFLIAEANTEQGLPWRVICYRHHIVRLAEGLREQGVLGEEAMQRGLLALQDFRSLLDQYDVALQQCRAVSTAAMRMAANAQDFVQRVQQDCGIQINIISGDQEASLSLRGCCAALSKEYADDMLLLDVGGGSSEFVCAHHGESLAAISRPLGVVRLSEQYLQHNPPSAADYQAMIDACQPELDIVEASWQQRRAPRTFVGTAGTITTLAATLLNIHPYNAERINNSTMRWSNFADLRDQLLAMSHAQRQNIPTIEPQRADLIISGLAIVEAVWQRWDYSTMIVVDAGLLEGVWMQQGNL